jgi:hypothetical protein
MTNMVELKLRKRLKPPTGRDGCVLINPDEVEAVEQDDGWCKVHLKSGRTIRLFDNYAHVRYMVTGNNYD